MSQNPRRPYRLIAITIPLAILWTAMPGFAQNSQKSGTIDHKNDWWTLKASVVSGLYFFSL